MRLSPGDKVILFDGTGNEYGARVISISSDRVDLEVTTTRQATGEPGVRLTVAQALLKNRKMDGLIRQLTELGIHHWQPFFSNRAIPRPTPAKAEVQTRRWETIAREAVKQCRRGRPPMVSAPVSFEEILTASENETIRLIFWENAIEPLSTNLPGPPFSVDQKVLIAIGPEGGFSKTEIEAAQVAGFTTVSLGPRILRAETAALTACALVLHLNELG